MKFFILLLLPFFCFSNMPPGGFNDYQNYYFVETGTFGGLGIKNAMSLQSFKQYHSIEINRGDYEFSGCEFSSCKDVYLYLGDSAEILSKVIKPLKKTITFWLDAHVWPPIEGQKNAPLIEELDAIKAHPIKTHTILIDDMSCCGTLAFDYITLEDLKKKILEINQKYSFKLIAGGDNSEVPKNILVAYLNKELQ